MRHDEDLNSTYMAVPWINVRGGKRELSVKENLNFRAKTVENRGQVVRGDSLRSSSLAASTFAH